MTVNKIMHVYKLIVTVCMIMSCLCSSK